MSTEQEIQSDTWRCFHCCEEFYDRESAATHFGSYRSSYPICKVDAAKYREMEAEVQSWQNESAPLQREVQSLHAEIARKSQEAEEKGYARGLRDAKRHPGELGLMSIPVEQAAIGSPSVDALLWIKDNVRPEPGLVAGDDEL